jgi:CRISPR-associated protein Cmr1
MNLTLHTLTPLWTGSVERGQMDRIHEIGLIGSLRWWYEAIVRGLGSDACDPTSDNRCPRGDVYYPVCQLFGATGKSRRFRIRVQEGHQLFAGDKIKLPSGRIHSSGRQNRVGAWFLESQAQMSGQLQLEISSLGSEEDVKLLLVPLALIHGHASLGAKVSNGYGVVSVTEGGAPVSVNRALLDRLPYGARPSGTLPDLRDFFFAKLSFQEPQGNPSWWQSIKGIAEAWAGQVTTSGGQTENVYHRNQQINVQLRNIARSNLQAVVQSNLLPLAPAVRNWLRYMWSSGLTNPQKNYLFGTTDKTCPRCCSPRFHADRNNPQNNWCPNCRSTFPKGQELDRLAAKINVTHAYRRDDGQWEFRIWGWIPCQTPDRLGLTRDTFITQFRAALTTPTEWTKVFGGFSTIVPSLTEWHARDCGDRSGRRYLEELLGLTSGGAQ